MKYILRIIDFETTGIPDDDEMHSVVEAACVEMNADTEAYHGTYETLVIPTTDMCIKALATHHIPAEKARNEGVEWYDAECRLMRRADDQVIIYVAHNADFEKQFFNPKGALWIDTYKVALYLYPDAPAHNNQVLKYYLGIDDLGAYHPPHRALPDCRLTTDILMIMSESMTFNEMIQITKQPPYLTKIGFGKHRGEKFEDLPYDYLQWLSRQDDMDEGVKAAVQRVMNGET